jgi:hypothetical protein
MKLTIEIATRGRPELLLDTVRTFRDNITEPDTTILICADRDDHETVEALYREDIEDDPHIKVSVKPREETRGLKYQRALTEAPADVYLVGVDHTPIRTKGFDRLILERAAQFPDGIGVVCTPMANASFPFLQAPTTRLVELMGYVQPPHFPFWFIDHWLDDIARMIGRYAMVDVKVNSNKHPGKTIGLRDVAFWASYFDLLAGERRRQANLIIDKMDEPEWRKAMLRGNFPMVEYRSRWVNDIVRQNAEALEEGRSDKSVDENYARVLERARRGVEEMLDTRPEAA